MVKSLDAQVIKIKSAQKCQARNGSIYFKLVIQDKDGNTSNAMVWDCDNSQALSNNNELLIISSSYDSNYKNYTITEFKLVKKSRLGLTESERENLFVDIHSHSLVENWLNYKLNDSSKKMLDDVNLFWINHAEQIKISPAAITHHHNYIGGLLQHTKELLDFIFTNATYLSDEGNKYAVAVAGALMHDAGKIFEYHIDSETGVIEYMDGFKSILLLDKSEKVAPHILYGYNWAIEKGYHELAHIIGSHHLISDFGALFTPATKEAQLVFMADYYSSKLGKISTDDLGELPIEEEPEKEALALISEDEIPY